MSCGTVPVNATFEKGNYAVTGPGHVGAYEGSRKKMLYGRRARKSNTRECYLVEGPGSVISEKLYG